ncbi:MAG: nuclear transport factor 2 family protein [Bacteroidota bacterium]|nr:nuclear transport factor 2 family protein [Bacteroidota bacterium]
MKRVVVYFLLVVTINSCIQQETLSKEEVIDAIKKFDDGWQNKNLNTVDSVLSPSYIYFTQSGGTFSRDSVVATAGATSYTLHDMSRSEFTVTLEGNTAIVSTRWKGKGTYRGFPFDEDQRCSITLVKKNNKVEILSEHCTPIKGTRIFH